MMLLNQGKLVGNKVTVINKCPEKDKVILYLQI